MNRRSVLARAAAAVFGVVAAVYAPWFQEGATTSDACRTIEIPSEDAAFLETQRFTVTEVTRLFGLTREQLTCKMT